MRQTHSWTLIYRETEKLKGELAKETETHKLSLRKREILFQKEIEAASAFIALHRTIEPKYSHPDMDWDEAMTDVADDFADIERKLRNYVAEYGAALSQQNRIEIDTCMTLASNHKFADREGRMAIDNARVTAHDVLNALKEIERRLLDELRS